MIYGRETPPGSPYKLKFDGAELVQIICLLKNASVLIRAKGADQKIGETKNFVVDYEGNPGSVMLYRKWFSEYRFKLAFNEKEIGLIIWILKKAESL